MKATVPGLRDKAKNPRFIKGIPRIVVPKRLPKSTQINNEPLNPTMQGADKVQRADLSNSGYHAVVPNRGNKTPKVTFGNF